MIGGIELLPAFFAAETGLDYVLPVQKLIPSISRHAEQYFRLSLVAALLLQYFSAAVLINAISQRLQARKILPFAALLKGVRLFLPLTAIGLFQSLGLSIGNRLVTGEGFIKPAIGIFGFIIPGLLMGMAWFVAPSVYTLEKHGVFASLKRSAWLTRGNRWKLFGIFALVLITDLLIRRAISHANTFLDLPRLFLVAYYLQTGIYISFSVTIGVIVYYDLRAAKEGLDIGRIADVFD